MLHSFQPGNYCLHRIQASAIKQNTTNFWSKMDEITIKEEPLHLKSEEDDNSNIRITIKEEILNSVEQTDEIDSKESINIIKKSKKKKPSQLKKTTPTGSAKISYTIKMENPEEIFPEQNDSNSKESQVNKKTRRKYSKILSCKMCNYKTYQLNKLNDHIAKHTGKKTYHCDDCGYSCQRLYRMMQHLRTHTGEKPFACQHCDYRSTSKELLTTHLKKHTGEKVFSCDICGYKTLNKHRLREHIRIHTGEKPFTCHLCNFKSAYENSLNSHLKIHKNINTRTGNTELKKEPMENHSIEIEIDPKPLANKLYQCDKCDYKTHSKHNLTPHITRHFNNKKYTCKICGFKSRSEVYLKYTHAKMHTGERPFTCDVCDYRSVTKNQLKRHLLKHSEGEKYKKDRLFNCEICGFKCSNQIRLMAHVRIHDHEEGKS